MVAGLCECCSYLRNISMAGILMVVYSMPCYCPTATEVACKFLIILAMTNLFLAYSCHGHIFSSRHLNVLSPFCYPDMGIHLARTARLLKVGHNQNHCRQQHPWVSHVPRVTVQVTLVVVDWSCCLCLQPNAVRLQPPVAHPTHPLVQHKHRVAYSLCCGHSVLYHCCSFAALPLVHGCVYWSFLMWVYILSG